jgi:predicted nucleic acid-binding protein
VLVSLVAKESYTYPVVLAQMRQYAQDGWLAYAPGVIVAEGLFALCRKLQNNILTAAQHARAVQRLALAMTNVLPPPNGDASLIERAEQIRGTYGCSRSADSLYIALAEHLAQTRQTELVTLDTAIPAWAASAAPSVTVRLLTP